MSIFSVNKSKKSTNSIFRTPIAKQSVCFVLLFIMLISFIFSPFTLHVDGYITVNAEDSVQGNLTDEEYKESGISYILMETERNQVLARQGIDTHVDASLLARMMTCVVALNNLSLTDTVTASTASSSYTDGYDIKAGKAYSVDTLIKAALIGNADNAALLLAEQVCNKNKSTMADFVSLMNDTAKLYKMSSTVFANADGSRNDFQQTTVYDTALFISNAIKDTRFKSIYCSPAVLIWDNIIISNPNNMVAESGANTTAGGTLAVNGNDEANSIYTATFLSETTSDDQDPLNSVSLVLIISGADKNTYATLGNLISDDFDNTYKKAAVVEKGEVIDKIKIESEDLILIAGKTAYCIMPKDQSSFVESVSYIYEKDYDPETLTPPIEAGTVIGYAQYLLKDGTSFQVSMAAKNSITGESARMNSFIEFYNENKGLIIAIAALLLIVIIMLVYNLYWFIVKKNYERRLKLQQEKSQQE